MAIPQLFQTLGERFADDHERTYGHRAPDDPIEVVNLRLTATVPTAKSQFSYLSNLQLLKPYPQTVVVTLAQRQVGLRCRCSFSREGLGSEGESGPFIVEEYDTTILVPPRCTARRDEMGEYRHYDGGIKTAASLPSTSHSMHDYKKGQGME